MHKKF